MLGNCNECGARISDLAEVCPNCGCPHREPEDVTVILKNPVATGVLLGFGFLICLAVIGAGVVIATAIVL